METFTTDNRYAAGGSGANPPDEAVAAYAARWIDLFLTADVLPDRQGFAYNDEADRDALRELMYEANIRFYQLDSLAPDQPRVQHFGPMTVCLRRSSGYIYCDAWLNAPAVLGI